MEEDEEELYSEMQLEDGGRRRVSVTSHNALKVSDCRATLGVPHILILSSKHFFSQVWVLQTIKTHTVI